MKKFMLFLFVLTMVSISAIAVAQQSKAVCVDCYDPNTPKAWDDTKINRDKTGQAAVYRDAVLADYGLTLSITVNNLQANCGYGAKPGDCNKAVEEAGKEARKPAPQGLNKRQKAQVKAMMDERDRAIIAAGSGDQEGLAAAVRNLDAQVAALEGRVTSLENRVTVLENGGGGTATAQAGFAATPVTVSVGYRLAEVEAKTRTNTSDIETLEGRIDALKASDATGPELDAKLEELKLELGTVVSEAKQELDARIVELEKLVARIEALEAKNSGAGLSAEDRAALDQLKAKAGQTLADIAEALKTAKMADDKATKAMATAEKALALAQTKMDAGLLELGVEGFFSPAIKAGMIEGAYVITKWRFRVALGGALGLAFDNGTEFAFDTRLRVYVVAHKYIWVGIFGSMYGVGIPFNDEFGYGGGAIMRFTTPMAENSEWGWGIEGWVGPAYEYGWVAAAPPEGALPGSVYDDQKLDGKAVPMGGVNLVFTR